METTSVRISDIINEDYKTWNPANMVFIFSGTGSGKTHFALNELTLWHLEQGHKILYLVPRFILQQQIETDMMKLKSKLRQHNADYFNNFEVCSYQLIEHSLLQHKDIIKYDVIICDEFHYWMTDSVFNCNTQLSYYYILRQSKSVRVLLSATPTDIKEFMDNDDNVFIPSVGNIKFSKLGNDKPITYTLPPDYSHLIVKYITKNDEIIEIIQKSYGKNLVFVSSKESGKTLKKTLDTNKITNVFITADNKNTDAAENVTELVNTNTFTEKVMLSTSVLDVGVNFLDTEIENIIIAATEPAEFLQMLGRIRVIQEGQEVKLFIHAMTAEHFQKLRDKHLAPKIQCIECLEMRSNDLENIFKDYKKGIYNIPDNYQDFLYVNSLKDDCIAINQLAVDYCKKLYTLYDEIYKNMKLDSDYFIKFQLSLLGLEDTFSVKNFYSLEIQKERMKILQEEIEREANKNTSTMEQKDCKAMLARLKPFVRKIDLDWVRSNDSLSIKMFNHICTIYSIPYRIAQNNAGRKNEYYLLKMDDNRIEQLKLQVQM